MIRIKIIKTTILNGLEISKNRLKTRIIIKSEETKESKFRMDSKRPFWQIALASK